MRWVPPEEALVGIGHVGPVAGSKFQGLEYTGWSDETWLLHPIFEKIYDSDERTYDEAFHDSLRASMPRTDFGERLGEILDRPDAVFIGARSGLAVDPGPEWRSIKWGAFLDRVGGTLEGHEFPPSYAWFPFRSWPLSMRSPVEGSMDLSTLRSLMELLSVESADLSESATYFLFAGRECPEYEARVAVGRLSDLWWVIDEHAQERRSTIAPQNMWAADSSWFTYTDIDLMATKVCGSARLIEGLRSDDRFDTLDWRRSTV